MAKKTKVPKNELVRLAIEAGADMPKAGVDWIQQHHGVMMKPNNFSNFKSLLSKGSGTSVAKQPAAQPRASSSVARQPAAKANAGEAISLDDLATLRQLVDRVGVNGITEAVQLLGGHVGNG